MIRLQTWWAFPTAFFLNLHGLAERPVPNNRFLSQWIKICRRFLAQFLRVVLPGYAHHPARELLNILSHSRLLGLLEIFGRLLFALEPLCELLICLTCCDWFRGTFDQQLVKGDAGFALAGESQRFNSEPVLRHVSIGFGTTTKIR